MHILQIASEFSPVAKVGGLADVLYGLSKALVKKGHQVEILIPKYDCLLFSQLDDLHILDRNMIVKEGQECYQNTIWTAYFNGLKILFLEPHHPQHYFNRGQIYGCKDDIERFTYFSKAAVEYLISRKNQPEIVHVHDWPTALIPVLYKELYPRFQQKTILTIHNMEHQGKCTSFHLQQLGLGKTNDQLQPSPSSHPINLLKEGIEYADHVTTVSVSYEQEIQTAEGAFGLQETVIKNRHKITGILNGIDEDFWNPEKDPHLVRNYPARPKKDKELKQIIEGKQENKQQLQVHLNLHLSHVPLVACISRLVPQKSPELIQYALERTLAKGGQFVLLGSTCIPSIYETFQNLQTHYQNHKDVSILLDQDESLAHLLFAATDLFIIPSLFEPCGLTQLIALRYSTIPIARMTGGLKDTVFDIDTSSRPFEERNGFTFEFPDTQGVDWALDRALYCYRNDPQKWEILLRNATKKDLSWEQSALEYIKLYSLQLNRL